MKAVRFALGVVLVFGSVVTANAASDASSAVDSIGSASILDSTGTRVRGGGDAEEYLGPSIDQEPSLFSGINVDAIPAGGLSIGGQQESHNQPNQLCKVYTSLAAFNTDHGPYTDAPGCVKCLEAWDDGTMAAAGLCNPGVVDTKFDCTSTLCFPPGGINPGIQVEETDLNRVPPSGPGILQAGPNWFANNFAGISGKFVLNNFFSDTLELRFTGHPAFPAACVGSTVPPSAIGFDILNHLNAAVNNNYVAVNLGAAGTFYYQAVGNNSGIFTGVCCTAPIQSIQLRNVGNFTEGVDNVRYGALGAGGCTVEKVQVTPNQLSDALEALETKLDNFDCGSTGGGTGSN